MTTSSVSVPLTADFRFARDEDLSELGGAATRFQHNVAAITLRKQLEAGARTPSNLSRDEQLTLARYTGWGGTEMLNRAFPNGAYSYARPRTRRRNRHFFGAMPDAPAAVSERVAVEMDDLTARILRWLYPQARVTVLFLGQSGQADCRCRGQMAAGHQDQADHRHPHRDRV